MIEEGQRVLLVHGERVYYVRAGAGTLSTDLGTISLTDIPGKQPGETIVSHKGQEFCIISPRPPDFFAHAARSGAPMLPRDIGFVIGLTGINHRDRVLDAGTGSGIAAIYFGGIAEQVISYERRPEFVQVARNNLSAAGLENVSVIEGDVLDAPGTFEVVHYDLIVEPSHVSHAYDLLSPGGFLACYTPFLEQTFVVVDEAKRLFREVHTHECIERELTRSARGTRPSTRVCHSGYITLARR